MPRRDGTGPMGEGAMTGRRLGFCPGTKAIKYGTGLGLGFGLGLTRRRRFRDGSGRRIASNQTFSKTQKMTLLEQKNLLQKRLEVIEKQLENL